MRTLTPREGIGRLRSRSGEPALVQATQLVSLRLALCWRPGRGLGMDVESSLTPVLHWMLRRPQEAPLSARVHAPRDEAHC